MAVLIGLLAWALLRPGDPNPLAATAAPTTSATHSAPQPTPTATPSDEMPPAWLAWISGSLPAGFAADVHASPTLGTTVVVAGDTRWMTSLPRRRRRRRRPADAPVRDPDRRVRRRSRRLCAVRARVQPLRRSSTPSRAGEAVLGTSSAALRHLDGGRLARRSTGRRCGSARSCPIPWPAGARCSCPATVGRTLGIVDDRYLLSMPDGAMTERRFASVLATLIPEVPVRTVRTGRVAVHADRLGREPTRRDEGRLR